MANINLTCPICGEPTSVWYGNARKDRLCRTHAQQLKDGIIEQCPDCGKWIQSNTICDCKQKATTVETPVVKQTPNKKEETTISTDLKCIICGESSNGQHFCRSCYHKFKDKILYIQISKCKEFIKLDAEYQSEFTCDDGHLVKSPYEKIIDDWLFREGINHAYEITLDVDETHDIHPDFYIPTYNGINDIYIEFWGYNAENAKYTEIKKYKESVYPKLCEERGITVLYLSKPDLNDANATLRKKLKYLKKGTVN